MRFSIKLASLKAGQDQPDFLDARKFAFDWLQDQLDPLAILQIGDMGDDFEEQALRIVSLFSSHSLPLQLALQAFSYSL